ncbi:hypothetical protein GOBAR_DD26171 [Gossypium barbadense]|nr:hypothetical protein GOBAR_DD26171 [Gossypium barbadense]
MGRFLRKKEEPYRFLRRQRSATACLATVDECGGGRATEEGEPSDIKVAKFLFLDENACEVRSKKRDLIQHQRRQIDAWLWLRIAILTSGTEE